MRRIVPLVATAVLFSTASVGYAATMTGTIKGVDLVTRSITLDNGKTFDIPSKMQLSSLRKGEKVKVTYKKVFANILLASSVTPAS